MIEIGITGIDGSGKTTFLEALARYLREHGYRVICIDIPYFSAVPPRFQRVGSIVGKMFRWADARQTKTVIAVAMVLSAALYLAIRWAARKSDVLLVEHHPRLEAVAFAGLYAGTFGSVLARMFIRLWPKPTMAVMLTVPLDVALERIQKRKGILQFHETRERLLYLESELRRSLGCFPDRRILQEPNAATFGGALIAYWQQTQKAHTENLRRD